MVVHEKTTSRKLVKTPLERMMEMREQISKRGVRVLAILPGQSERLGEQLGIEETVVCQTVEEQRAMASSLRKGRVVASAIEIQQPDGAMPEKIINGQNMRALDYVHSLDHSARLGRVDVTTALGTSALAIVSELPRDPLLRDVIREGADPTAMMIARPYEVAA